MLRLDVANNRLVVTDNPKDLEADSFSINKINWILGEEPKQRDNLSVQIRYNSRPESIKQFSFDGETTGRIELIKPVRAITPGQSAVFYKGDELIGGGIII